MAKKTPKVFPVFVSVPLFALENVALLAGEWLAEKQDALDNIEERIDRVRSDLTRRSKRSK